MYALYTVYHVFNKVHLWSIAMWCKNVLTIDDPDSAVKEFQTKVYTNEYCVIDAESICPTQIGRAHV